MSQKKSTASFLTILAITIALFGCTQSPESNVARNSEANQPAQLPNANSQSNIANASNNPEMSNTSASNVNLAPSGNRKSVSKMPEPKIGSGGNDMAMILMARGKLSSDKDLINNVIVEVKEGNATLTGKVATEDQKKKAEDLTKSVEGIQSVKNNLRVSP